MKIRSAVALHFVLAILAPSFTSELIASDQAKKTPSSKNSDKKTETVPPPGRVNIERRDGLVPFSDRGSVHLDITGSSTTKVVDR